MSKTPYLPFDKIKQGISIDEVMNHTGLTFIKQGNSYRCECPVHQGGKRSLVVSPNEKDAKGDFGVYYCHSSSEGGDRIGLLAHVKQIGQYASVKELAEAFNLLSEKVSTVPITVPQEKTSITKGERGFQPLDYLQPQHPSVQALGISPDVASELGIGFAPRGFHRGCVAIPVRTVEGQLVGYIGFDGQSVRLPPKWKL